MSSDHIPLCLCQVGIFSECVFECPPWVCEAMKAVGGVFVVPIIKIIIMKKSTANKLVHSHFRAESLMVAITEIGDLDGMVKGVAFYVMAMMFHRLEFFGGNDLLDQTMKFFVL